MRVLCVAEKPSMATELSKILSQGNASRRAGLDQYCSNWDFNYQFQNRNCSFTMTSIRGHIMSLDFIAPYNKWLSCQPLYLFEAQVQKSVSEEMKNVEKNLLREARNAQALMIWTDCDREGENIGEEVADICKKANPGIIVYRAKFSVIQPSHIHNACKNPGILDINQVQAVNTRMVIDLRIGASLTRFQTLSLKAAFPELDKDIISYGSCQFPTLGFIVEQYDRVKSFIPEKFWYIFLSYTKEEKIIEFKWKRNKLFDYFISVILYESCMTNPIAKVIFKNEKPTSKWKPLPLTTIELQKAASKILKISSDETMTIAEKLYNQGFISYPRTETDQYANNFDFKALIEKQLTHPQWGQFANSLNNQGKFSLPRKGKNNDNSHPPIHPTALVLNLAGNDKKIYEFITRRFLACCSIDAKGFQTDIEAEVTGEIFTTSGLVVAEKNYLEVYPYEQWNDKSIPNLEFGETFTPTIFELREGVTSAPKLLTEAELIGLMDKNLIGTDATIQDHIKKILDRNYAYKEGPQQLFRPTNLGIGLVEGYNNIGLERSLTKPLLRKQLEYQLKKVCDGSLRHERVMTDSLAMYKEMFIKSFGNLPILVNALKEFFHFESSLNLNSLNSTVFNISSPVMNCSNCQSKMVIRNKNDKWYIGCQSFPNCKCSIWMDSTPISNLEVTDELCPKCLRTSPNLKANLLLWTFSDTQIESFFRSNKYKGCVRCDENIENLLNVRQSNGSAASSRGNNTSTYSAQTRNQYGQSNNSTVNRSASTYSRAPQSRNQYGNSNSSTTNRNTNASNRASQTRNKYGKSNNPSANNRRTNTSTRASQSKNNQFGFSTKKTKGNK